jgi:predicted membrane-bound mannosyltransferase
VSPKFLSPIPKSILLSFIAVIILGIVIRLVAISVPLYGDELATISIWASMPILDIPTHYEYPNNHIFHTLVVATILKIFGLEPFLLHTPVLICGIVSIALAFLTTHRITRNFHAGLAVSFLIAINGGHIFYSTNARGYMLVLLIGQYIFHRLIVWIDESKVYLRETREFLI